MCLLCRTRTCSSAGVLDWTLENLSADDENKLDRTRNMLLLVAGKDLFNHHHMPNYIGMFAEG